MRPCPSSLNNIRDYEMQINEHGSFTLIITGYVPMGPDVHNKIADAGLDAVNSEIELIARHRV